MLTEKEILEKGYEEVADNLYLKEGNLYVQHKGQLKFASSLSDEELDQITDLEVYKRLAKKNEKPENPKKKEEKPGEKKEAIVPKDDNYLRGTEGKIVRLMDTKLQLDSIVAASEDKSKPGEGLLWHELVFYKKTKTGSEKRIHKEPSVELVDMIAQDMGHITTKIIEFNMNTLEDPNTHKKYLTYYCVVEATDGITKTSGLGAAEQIIDFNEIENNGRTFARTNAIRKAERNAKERMIPLPRRALVELVIRKLEEHQKGVKKQ